MAVSLYQPNAVSTRLNEELKRELSGIKLSKSKVDAAIRYFGTLPINSYREEVNVVYFDQLLGAITAES